jgi:hypothetical protein
MKRVILFLLLSIPLSGIAQSDVLSTVSTKIEGTVVESDFNSPNAIDISKDQGAGPFWSIFAASFIGGTVTGLFLGVLPAMLAGTLFGAVGILIYYLESDNKSDLMTGTLGGLTGTALAGISTYAALLIALAIIM